MCQVKTPCFHGLVYDADEVLSYMDAKLSGRKAVAPKARKL